ncbi:hypothetical protein ACX1F1_17480 [Yersinia pseudotuberculosis]|uniref:hypothetical protein n=1 Tax=Yersinia pseudotuberculosis TaxID=633 RepID=UPI001A9E7A9F|nr:hypothetical protein [Yersinia pseudotuberculosis]MBO1632290.1 hypothetical protein [Yersinia pseudotuberculosis]MBP0069823.1 hypothetical protein [Yersinia pseudotuberculosis]
MNNVGQVRELLAELVRSTASPVYAACDKIVSYLEQHSQQRNLTIGGLRAALEWSESDDNVLIQAAFALTAHPFQALEVRYKLYDTTISDVLEELDHPTYLAALSEGHFTDDDGNYMAFEELNSRVFPYFVSLLKDNIIAKPHVMMRYEQ